jgi:hypothetical protein
VRLLSAFFFWKLRLLSACLASGMYVCMEQLKFF